MNTQKTNFANFIKSRAPIIGVISLSIALGLAAIYHRAATNQYQSELNRVQRQLTADRFVLWRYGTIKSVDPSKNSIVVSIATNVGNERSSRDFNVHVSNETLLQKQTFAREGSTVTGIASIERASFAEVEPGMNVSISIDNESAFRGFSARSLIIGDPL